MSQHPINPPPVVDKLRDGPCADVYANLTACQARKNIRRADRALTACVDETDRLITCIHKNPEYFLAK